MKHTCNYNIDRLQVIPVGLMAIKLVSHAELYKMIPITE